MEEFVLVPIFALLRGAGPCQLRDNCRCARKEARALPPAPGRALGQAAMPSVTCVAAARRASRSLHLSARVRVPTLRRRSNTPNGATRSGAKRGRENRAQLKLHRD
eukprot:6180585-Pleurochrysis_carterae.AAC.1